MGQSDFVVEPGDRLVHDRNRRLLCVNFDVLGTLLDANDRSLFVLCHVMLVHPLLVIPLVLHPGVST